MRAWFQKPGSAVRWRYFGIAALPIGVLLGSELLLTSWSSSIDGFTQAIRAASRASVEASACALAESAARLEVLSFVLAVFGLSLFAAALFVRHVSTHYTLDDVRRLAVAFLVYLLLGVLSLFVASWAPRLSLDVAKVYGIDLHCGEHLRTAKLVLDTVNGALVVSAAVVVTGAVCSLFHASSGHTVGQWREQVRHARMWLYLATAILVAGLFCHRAWSLWLVVCFDAKSHKAYENLIAASTLYRGVQYSLFLAAIFLPVLGILHAQACRLALEGKPRGSVDNLFAVLKRRKLDMSLPEMAKTLAAILAPFVVALAGPIGDALKIATR